MVGVDRALEADSEWTVRCVRVGEPFVVARNKPG